MPYGQTQEKATPRRATRGDVGQLAALFQAVYVNSSHPFQSAADIEAFLADERNFEIVIEIDQKIVAGAAMTYAAWNDAYEFGRAITHPDFQRQGLAGLVMQQVVQEVCQRTLGSVFFGFPRVRRVADLSATLEPPFIAVGHDDGRNVVNGQREVHLIVYAVPGHARFLHVAPPVPHILHAPFLREHVFRPLGLAMTPGEYPPECFVGPPCRRQHTHDGFVFDYEASAPNRAVEIVGHLTPTVPATDVCAQLNGLLQELPNAEHVTVTVLADKVDLIRQLCGAGFQITAYLPAWYAREHGRFDCIQLVRASGIHQPRVQGFDATLATLRVELPRLFGASDTPVPLHRATTAPASSAGRQRSTGAKKPHPELPQQPPDALSWRPVVFRWRHDHERQTCMEVIRREPGLRICDTLLCQLQDLLRSRHPEWSLPPAELDRCVDAHLNGASREEYGAWVHYPWSGRLVHLLDREEFIELRTDRNRYKITPQEQAVLASKRVGVVGLSVGQSIALTLVLERACGEIRLADFDAVDLSNLNRIRTGVHNLGVPKVIVTAREIAEIDPYVSVTIFAEGLTPENLQRYFSAGGGLDAVVEECDSLDIKVLVRHAARRHRIPVVMATSDRGMLDIERFDLEPERPLFHGLAGDLEPVSLRGLTSEQKLPIVLRISGTETLSTRLRASMVEIGQTLSTWPQLGSAVTLGGGAAAEAVRRILLRDDAPSGRYFLDVEGMIRSALPAVEVLPPAAPGAIRVQPPRLQAPCGAITLDRALLGSLVERACLAPSGGNTQPWLWLSQGASLHLFLDANRSSGLIDVAFGGSYAALGAAAENLRLAAHQEGLEMCLQTFPCSDDARHAATFTFFAVPGHGVEEHWRDDLSLQMARRHTNRQLGNQQPVAGATLAALTAAVRSIPGADVQWLTGAAQLERIGRLVGMADRLRLLHPQLHRELFHELRWTRADVESSRDGIDVETLHLSPSDYAGLCLCRHWPTLDLIRQWHLGRKFEILSQQAIQSASAVGLLTMPEARALDYFNGGRALQRMWLTATEHALAVHPMTTLPYFFARVLRANGAGLDGETTTRLRELRPAYAQLFHLPPPCAEVLLFRLSGAEATARRALRRPIDQVLQFWLPEG
jgi:molybdopterin/thiamine biosynthesis adenylyltransferase